MKKIFCTMLCLILTLSCFPVAHAADDFTLRNGILFGDTMEDILSKETTLVRESDDSNFFKGKIAGYSNAACSFTFDNAGGLAEMTYTFDDSCTSKDTMNEVYDTLYQSLKRQYGTPLGNTGGSCHLITGNALFRMALYVYLLGGSDGYSGSYADYDEWVVDCNGYHVKIDLASYYYRNKDYKYSYFCDVSYHYFTDADLEAARTEKQNERQEVDNDL